MTHLVPDQALENVRVLDLSTGIAGPYCGKLLTEFGAEVLKVEAPGTGDRARAESPFLEDIPHPEKSGLFLYLNMGKKSITLDPTHSAGTRLFQKLVRDVDVVLESFAPGTMARLGLGYDSLEKLNPRLVVTSVSNFGQYGPYRDYKASEMVEYALSGLMYIVGFPDREPLKPGGFQAQYQAGLNAAVATLAALYGVGVSGVGQHVDISIMDTVMSALEGVVLQHVYRGETRVRSGSRYGMWGPRVDIFPCKDGHLVLALNTEDEWGTFCHFMGRPDLLEDPRYGRSRVEPEDTEDLADILREWFREKKKMDVFFQARDWRVPVGLVPEIDELVNDAHFKARDFFVEIEHPATGLLKYPGAPFAMGETPGRSGRAPLLGEHNQEVYCAVLGYSRQELAKLRQVGAI
ncbi:MAG: CaiB/BaiF CoA transferase family protein [Dehalococcoidia bacterium]